MHLPMIELSQIYEDLTACGAHIYLYDIGFAEAATLAEDGNHNRFGVFVDAKTIRSIADFKYKLVHECGHCATGALHKTNSPYDLVEKHEHKANRWAFEKYLTVDHFIEAFLAGNTTTWELSIWFDMPEEYIEKALDYYIETKAVNFNQLVQIKKQIFQQSENASETDEVSI